MTLLDVIERLKSNEHADKIYVGKNYTKQQLIDDLERETAEASQLITELVNRLVPAQHIISYFAQAWERVEDLPPEPGFEKLHEMMEASSNWMKEHQLAIYRDTVGRMQ